MKRFLLELKPTEELSHSINPLRKASKVTVAQAPSDLNVFIIAKSLLQQHELLGFDVQLQEDTAT